MPRILALLTLLSLIGCASHKPVHVEPPPPIIHAKPKPQLRPGDWIINGCLESGESCYCHRPAEHLDVKGTHEHKVIECRK